jgi:hypothetical protein
MGCQDDKATGLLERLHGLGAQHLTTELLDTDHAFSNRKDRLASNGVALAGGAAPCRCTLAASAERSAGFRRARLVEDYEVIYAKSRCYRGSLRALTGARLRGVDLEPAGAWYDRPGEHQVPVAGPQRSDRGGRV